MSRKTQVEQIAAFAQSAELEGVADTVLARFKIHILDTVGCAIGALGSEPPRAVRRAAAAYDALDHGPCTLIGGGRATPDRATLVNGSLVRYLDFMDNFLAPEQTCHPCDTFAAVLAAAEAADLSGHEFMTALAIAYQVFCRLMEVAPVQEAGFDHTVQLAYGVAAGTARALGLSVDQTAQALALAGASAQGLVITRADYLSNWKGLQSADVAMSAFGCVLLAREGITGPLQVLDGQEGFPKAFKRQVQLDWQREQLDVITRCSIKAHNAEVHTQPVLEAVLAAREQHALDQRLDAVERIDVEVFKQAYDITGAGEEAGDKYDVRTKEQADHSLPYLVAVALLDGQVTPQQFTPERIARQDVQLLLHKVRTLRDDLLTRRYPSQTPCRVVFELTNEPAVICEADSWLGFFKRPVSWSEVREKFDAVAAPHSGAAWRDEVAELIHTLEHAQVRALARLLGAVTG